MKKYLSIIVLIAIIIAIVLYLKPSPRTHSKKWLMEMIHGDVDAKWAAIKNLKTTPEIEVIASTLVISAHDKNSVLQCWAIQLLAETEMNHRKALELLLPLANHELEDIRAALATALPKLAGKSQKIRWCLLKLCRDHSPFVRKTAVKSLAERFAKDTSIAEFLLNMSCHEVNGEVQTQIVIALGNMDLPQKFSKQYIVPRLMKIVQEQLGDAKYQAIQSLGQLGGKSEEIVVSLASMLNYQDTRRITIDALVSICKASKKAVKKLRVATTQEQSDVVLGIYKIWAHVGTEESIGYLLAVVKEPSTQQYALEALTTLEPQQWPVILQYAMQSNNADVYPIIANVLGASRR